MMPHPPPTGGPKAVTGAYRTTIYKRDHKRLQAQRKLPPIGNETVAATKETHEVYESSKPVQSQPAFLSKVTVPYDSRSSFVEGEGFWCHLIFLKVFEVLPGIKSSFLPKSIPDQFSFNFNPEVRISAESYIVYNHTLYL